MKTKYFLIIMILGFQFCFSQVPASDSIALNAATLKIEKAEHERISLENQMALEKADKERVKELEKAEKEREKAEKAQKKAEKELKKLEKERKKLDKARSNVAKDKKRISSQSKDIVKNTEKFEKLKRKGKLSPNDEIKWLDRLKKKQEKLEDLKEDLKKSEKKLDKLD